MGDRILKLQEVIDRTTLSSSSIYLHMSRGNFPQQIKLSLRAVGWAESEINAWMDARKSERDAGKETTWQI